MSHVAENKRLAKNTIALFARSIIVIVVALYVSRILLEVLGVEDFGIYQVVGSIVVLFSFINNAMASASQRFITFELGSGSIEKTNKVFSASMVTQFLVAISLILIVEVFGIWFLNNKLNIPQERVFAANLVFQFSIITFCINVVRVPFDASVIAYEKMTFLAYASIIDAFFKLLIVLLLKINGFDKLIIYAMLLSGESLLMWLIYYLYCRKKFESCHFKIIKDIKLYKKLMSYTGWSLFGNSTNVLTQQAFTFLINIYYGVAVNAAIGIANQVNSAIMSFVGSFQTSYKPQVVKSYAQKEWSHVNQLISTTSKISFALMIIPTLILIFNMPLLLNVWLGHVPTYAVQFCQIILICAMIDALSSSYNVAIMATSEIRNYQITISISFFLDILVSYLLIKFGVLPYLVLISRIATRGVLNMIIGLSFAHKQLCFDVKHYTKSCLIPILFLLTLVIPLLLIMSKHFTPWNLLWMSSIYIIIVSVLLILFILFNNQERLYLKDIVLSKFFKRLR